MDLINGKAMYCPECGHHLSPHGKVNGATAHVEAYCPACDKGYHWIAYIGKNNAHKIVGFHHMFHTKSMKAEY